MVTNALLHGVRFTPADHFNKITKKTNADRLRAMTDEELAERLQEYECPPSGIDACAETCTACWLRWLQKPVEVQSDG